ncbi:MAG: hypothetical protein KDK23_10585 [Leptospiraceae bacterium]|nr:hypothetical protein [Leptospiraceae bacterium]
MEDFLNCIVDVHIPDLEGLPVADFQELRKDSRPARTVSEINLEWTRTANEQIFQGIPDESELMRTFGCSEYRARQLLNFEVMCLRLMRIRMERVSYEINRKTEGYISTNQDLLSILEERVRKHINGILNLNSTRDQALDRFKDHFMDHVTVLEGSSEGRLIRLYLAIRQIQEKVEKFELFGTSQFHDALERRLLKKLEALERRASQSEEPGFPEPPADRRAEDSPLWKRFEQEQLNSKAGPADPGGEAVLEGQETDASGEAAGAGEDPPTGSISWEASFSALGPFFTVRILLRRGLYSEIKRWLMEDEGRYSPELPRILMDCIKTEQNIRNRQNSVPDELEEIITLLQRVMREG